MASTLASLTLGRLLYIGAPLVTVFLITGIATDPVNMPKLVALGAVAFALLFVLSVYFRKQILEDTRTLLVLILLFGGASLNSVLNSNAPASQTFFGTYGRNTGLLTYLMLSIVLLGASQVRTSSDFTRIVFGMLVAGAINVIYCAWVLIFGDFIGWNNLYGEILGLFGNPDFISAFLGIFLVVVFALILDARQKFKSRLAGFLFICAAFTEIVMSKAIQGLVVALGGLTLVLFFFIRSKVTKKWITGLYLLLASSAGVLAVLGTLQKGPFDFIYKRSVSLRGSYWRAGIEMGQQHLWTGVGMDTYGDWYRRTRPPVALIDLPGVATISNVSHNVFIDLFASGGIPLISTYLLTLALCAFSTLKVIRRTKRFDSTFVSIVAAWSCYQVQAIISINQIGLAIWGWLLSGLLIAYEIATRPKSEINVERIQARKNKIGKNSESVISPALTAGIGAMIGVLVSVPPLSADAKWFSALKSRNANQVELALVPAYMNPSSTYRYTQAVNLFSSSGLPELALKYARISVKFNPDDFTSWLQLYWLEGATTEEKSQSLMNLKRLDPKNSDVTNRNPQ